MAGDEVDKAVKGDGGDSVDAGGRGGEPGAVGHTQSEHKRFEHKKAEHVKADASSPASGADAAEGMLVPLVQGPQWRTELLAARVDGVAKASPGDAGEGAQRLDFTPVLPGDLPGDADIRIVIVSAQLHALKVREGSEVKVTSSGKAVVLEGKASALSELFSELYYERPAEDTVSLHFRVTLEDDGQVYARSLLFDGDGGYRTLAVLHDSGSSPHLLDGLLGMFDAHEDRVGMTGLMERVPGGFGQMVGLGLEAPQGFSGPDGPELVTGTAISSPLAAGGFAGSEAAAPSTGGGAPVTEIPVAAPTEAIAVGSGPSVPRPKPGPGNQAPEVEQAAAFTVGHGASLSIPDIDVDDLNDTDLTVTLSVLHGMLDIDELAAGGVGAGGITGDGTGTVILTGDKDAIKATLAAGVTYQAATGSYHPADTLSVTAADSFNATASTSTAITVSPSADPVLGFAAGSGAYTENASLTVIDPGLTLTDGDSANLQGGTITVTSATAADQLGIVSAALGAGAVRLNGGNVEYSDTGAAWAVIGTATGGSNGSDLVITLNAAATPAAVQATLRHLGYSNSSDDPAASTTVGITVSDGGGGTSTTEMLTVNITPVNDAPTLANAVADQSASSGAAFSFTFAATAFADVDTSSLTYTATKGDGTALPGWLSFDGATRSFSGTPGFGDIGSLTVKLTADDGNTTVSDTFDIVTGSDLAASNLTLTGSYTEDTVHNLTDIAVTGAASTITATLTLDTPAAGALSTGTSGAVTSSYNAGTGVWTATGARADVNALLAGVAFTPAADGHGDIVIATEVTDGQATATGSHSLTGTAVNDAPVLATPLADQFATVAAGLAFTLPGGSFTDVDTGDALAYTAELWNGTAWTALPAWLSHNNADNSFTIAPGAGTDGGYRIRVTATDSTAASAQDEFTIGLTSTYYGTAGIDVMNGSAAAEVIVGLGDNDTIQGLDGNDTLLGSEGDDYLYGDTSWGGAAYDDLLYGGDGNDRLYGDSGNATGSGNDTLYGEGGNDYLYGYAGDDSLDGGSGNDSLYGGDGGDTLAAGAGNDYLYGENGDDSLSGGDGNDTIDGGAGQDTIDGGAGNDVITYYVHANSTIASPDLIRNFTQGEDLFHLLIFNNIVAGQGNAANRTLEYYHDSGNTIVRSDGTTYDFSIVIEGTHTLTSADFFFLSDVGTPGNDTLNASTNPAGILGLDGHDSITGSAGHDFIWGDAGNDSIMAGNGNDNIYGGNGDDYIYGGNQQDYITGGAGADQFVYRTTYETGRYAGGFNGSGDVIYDFEQGTDKIVLDGLPFTGIQAGAGTGSILGYSYNAGTDITLINTPYYYHSGGTDFYLQLKGQITLTAADFEFHYDDGSGFYVGTSAAQGIVGSAGADTIVGGGGADEIFSGTGNDIIFLDGDSRLVNIGGSDTVVAGTSSTHFFHNRGPDAILYFGGAGSDLYYGNVGSDIFYARCGHDNSHKDLSSGNDYYHGGEGNDSGAYGSLGSDTMIGGYGQDRLIGGYSSLTSNGADTYIIHDPLESSSNAGFGDERDRIEDFNSGDGDIIQLYGFSGWGDGTGTTLDISGTLVTISAIDYTEVFNSDLGFSFLVRGDFRTTWATPATRDDDIQIGAGNIYTTGNDLETGDSGFLFGMQGDDTLTGSAGVDSIFGGHGTDSLGGAGGDDSLSGGYANDTLDGGAGEDTLEGGSGADTFIFSDATHSTTANPDEIFDFKHGNDADKIDLSAFAAGAGITGFGDLTIALDGYHTTITHAGSGFQIKLIGYFEAGTDLTATDFIF